MTVQDITPIFPSFKKNLKRTRALAKSVDYLREKEIKKDDTAPVQDRVDGIKQKADKLVQSTLPGFDAPAPAPQPVEAPAPQVDAPEEISDKEIKQILDAPKRPEGRQAKSNAERMNDALTSQAPDFDSEQDIKLAPEENYAASIYTKILNNYAATSKSSKQKAMDNFQRAISSQPTDGTYKEGVQNFASVVANNTFRRWVKREGISKAVSELGDLINNLDDNNIDAFNLLTQSDHYKQVSGPAADIFGDLKDDLMDDYKKVFVDTMFSIYDDISSDYYNTFVRNEDNQDLVLRNALRDLPIDEKNVKVSLALLSDSIRQELMQVYGQDENKVNAIMPHIKHYLKNNYKKIPLKDWASKSTVEDRNKLLDEFNDSGVFTHIKKLQGIDEDAPNREIALDRIGGKELQYAINKFVAELRTKPGFQRHKDSAELTAAKIFGSNFYKHYKPEQVRAYMMGSPVFVKKLMERVNELIEMYNGSDYELNKQFGLKPKTKDERIGFEFYTDDLETLSKNDIKRLKAFYNSQAFAKIQHFVATDLKQYNDNINVQALKWLGDMQSTEILSYMTEKDNDAGLFLDIILTDPNGPQGRAKTQREAETNDLYFQNGAAFLDNPFNEEQKFAVKDLLNSPLLQNPEILKKLVDKARENQMKSTGNFEIFVHEITPLVTGSYYKPVLKVDGDGRTMTREESAFQYFLENPFIQRVYNATKSDDEFKKFVKFMQGAIEDVGVDKNGKSPFLENLASDDVKEFFSKPIMEREVAPSKGMTRGLTVNKRTETEFDRLATKGKAPAQHSAFMQAAKKGTGNKEVDANVGVYAVPIYDKFFESFRQLYSGRRDPSQEASRNEAREELVNYLNDEMASTLFEDQKPFNFIANVDKIKDPQMKYGVLEAAYILKKLDEPFYNKLASVKDRDVGKEGIDVQSLISPVQESAPAAPAPAVQKPAIAPAPAVQEKKEVPATKPTVPAAPAAKPKVEKPVKTKVEKPAKPAPSKANSVKDRLKGLVRNLKGLDISSKDIANTIEQIKQMNPQAFAEAEPQINELLAERDAKLDKKLNSYVEYAKEKQLNFAQRELFDKYLSLLGGEEAAKYQKALEIASNARMNGGASAEAAPTVEEPTTEAPAETVKEPAVEATEEAPAEETVDEELPEDLDDTEAFEEEPEAEEEVPPESQEPLNVNDLAPAEAAAEEAPEEEAEPEPQNKLEGDLKEVLTEPTVEDRPFKKDLDELSAKTGIAKDKLKYYIAPFRNINEANISEMAKHKPELAIQPSQIDKAIEDENMFKRYEVAQNLLKGRVRENNGQLVSWEEASIPAKQYALFNSLMVFAAPQDKMGMGIRSGLGRYISREWLMNAAKSYLPQMFDEDETKRIVPLNYRKKSNRNKEYIMIDTDDFPLPAFLKPVDLGINDIREQVGNIVGNRKLSDVQEKEREEIMANSEKIFEAMEPMIEASKVSDDRKDAIRTALFDLEKKVVKGEVKEFSTTLSEALKELAYLDWNPDLVPEDNPLFVPKEANLEEMSEGDRAMAQYYGTGNSDLSPEEKEADRKDEVKKRFIDFVQASVEKLRSMKDFENLDLNKVDDNQKIQVIKGLVDEGFKQFAETIPLRGTSPEEVEGIKKKFTELKQAISEVNVKKVEKMAEELKGIFTLPADATMAVEYLDEHKPGLAVEGAKESPERMANAERMLDETSKSLLDDLVKRNVVSIEDSQKLAMFFDSIKSNVNNGNWDKYNLLKTELMNFLESVADEVQKGQLNDIFRILNEYENKNLYFGDEFKSKKPRKKKKVEEVGNKPAPVTVTEPQQAEPQQAEVAEAEPDTEQVEEKETEDVDAPMENASQPKEALSEEDAAKKAERKAQMEAALAAEKERKKQRADKEAKLTEFANGAEVALKNALGDKISKLNPKVVDNLKASLVKNLMLTDENAKGRAKQEVKDLAKLARFAAGVDLKDWVAAMEQEIDGAT